MCVCVCVCRVASYSDRNLMKASNLGVVWGPTLMRPERESVASIVNIKYQNIIVEEMVDEVEKVGHRGGMQETGPITRRTVCLSVCLSSVCLSVCLSPPRSSRGCRAFLKGRGLHRTLLPRSQRGTLASATPSLSRPPTTLPPGTLATAAAWPHSTTQTVRTRLGPS